MVTEKKIGLLYTCLHHYTEFEYFDYRYWMASALESILEGLRETKHRFLLGVIFWTREDQRCQRLEQVNNSTSAPSTVKTNYQISHFEQESKTI